jgi:AraC-like DNA-binding protein
MAVAAKIVDAAPGESSGAAAVGGLHGELVHAWLAALSDLGISARDTPLVGDALREPLCRVPVEVMADVLRNAATARRDPLIGVQLAQRRRAFGILHYLMISQRNLRDALAQLARFSGLLMTGATARLTGCGAWRTLVVWPALPAGCGHIAEACLAAICLELQVATDGRLRFGEVWLRGRAHGRPDDYEAVFGCRVRFGRPEHALVLPASALRLRMLRSNRDVAQRLEQEARAELEILSAASARARVEAVVRAALRSGVICSRAAVVQRLACSPRMLRRALEAEGTSYRAIEQDLRRELALALVGGGQSLVQVAGSCGFATLPAFSKAFRRWTTTAPSEFRRRQGAAVPALQRVARTATPDRRFGAVTSAGCPATGHP